MQEQSKKRPSGNNGAGRKQEKPYSGSCLTVDAKGGQRKRDSCIFCDTAHESGECKTAQGLSLVSRRMIVKRSGECLKRSHRASECVETVKCVKCCSDQHHTLLHFDRKNHEDDHDDHDGKKTQEEKNGVKVTSAIVTRATGTLPVASCIIEGETKEAVSRGALLDYGASATFVSDKLADAVGMRLLKKSKLSLQVFGKKEPTMIDTREMECTFRSMDGGKRFKAHVYAVQELGVVQGRLEKSSKLARMARNEGMHLSDRFKEDDVVSDRVHVVIGTNLLGKVVSRQRQWKDLTHFETVFGDVLAGVGGSSGSGGHYVRFVKLGQLDQQLRAFWEIEEVPQRTMEDVTADYLRDFWMAVEFDDVEGRYVVPILWKGDERPADNRHETEKQYKSVHRKWESAGRWSEYENVIKEYKDFGAVELDPKPEEKGFFLPHHAVVREGSETHRLRIVFNASAKTRNGLSLNDCVDAGPNLLPSILGVLLAFRQGDYAATADIEKAFLNLIVYEKDRRYMRFWFEGEVWRLSRVGFGINCSPLLLNATIRLHLENGDHDCPEWVVQKIKRSLYVDDAVPSFRSAEEAEVFKEKAVEVFKRAGMRLHKWRMSGEKCEKKPVQTVLGIGWHVAADVLTMDQKEHSRPVNTKRSFLSVLGTVFDPLGLVGPFTVKGKILLQEIWRVKVGWDDKLPQNLQKEACEWMDAMNAVHDVRFVRSLGILGRTFSLHLFVDASEKAYGACVYSVMAEGSHLVCSKTKVAPVKQVSLPRLELMGALTGVKLLRAVLANLEETPVRVVAWTDSRVVLAWIRSETLSLKWSTFVANRVTLINELVEAEWRHVPGIDNPADLASRGTTDFAKLEDEMWKHGPMWLCEESEWPPDLEWVTTIEEQKTQPVFLVQAVNEFKAQKVESWELGLQQFGENEVLKTIQAESYPEELACLKEGRDVSRRSPLWTLKPQMDEDGVLRVGGRLDWADVPDEVKHPVILPGEHELVRQMMVAEHERLQHGSVNTVLTSLRERFWIIRGRWQMKKIKRKCMTCVRFDTRLPVVNEVAAPLPRDRVTLQRPFGAVGVDYTGPVLVKGNSGTVNKVWILVVVCAASRALDLEVVQSVKPEDFVMAWRRFMAKKAASPKLVRSDNATTFTKASKILTGLEWRFNPPAAPWWGGFFESFVKLTKRPLRKVLGGAFVTLSELETILLEVELAVNSRPLTRLSDDPADANPITPLHLMGKWPEISVAHEVELNEHEMRKRAKYVFRLARVCRERWQKEYLTTLMERHKGGFQQGKDLTVGDLAIVVMDHKDRAFWPVGRVTEVFPGKDKRVRMVEVQVEDRRFVRPIQRLIPLEVGVSDDTPK